MGVRRNEELEVVDFVELGQATLHVLLVPLSALFRLTLDLSGTVAQVVV